MLEALRSGILPIGTTPEGAIDGQTTMFPAYDGADRLLALTRPDGAPVGLAYDATGNVTGVTPPGQPAHTFGYTPVDIEDRYTPPALGPGDWHTQYGYDLDRRLARVTRPDGLALVPGYDSAGRPVRRTTPQVGAITGLFGEP